MYEKRNIFLLVATLIVLFIGINSVCATNNNYNQTLTNTYSNNTILSDDSNSITQDNIINLDANNTKSLLKTTKKIDTESIVENKNIKSDNTNDNIQEITVTDGNYGRYFSGEDGTKNTVSSNSKIILSGEFNNKTFYLDKIGLTLTGLNTTLNNAQIYITEDAPNSMVCNITINSQDYDTSIYNEAENVTITNNNVSIINSHTHDENTLTQGIVSVADNTIISNNSVNVQGHAYDIDWTGGDRQGLVSTLGILNWGGNNVLIENNTVDVNKLKDCPESSYSTIDGIELKNGNNVTINNNKVNITGARFLYAINALDQISNITISNNTLNITGTRYIDGVQIGNYATNCNITGNKITGTCYNTTIFTDDNEAMAFGIITTNMGGTGPTINMTVSNNMLDLNSTIVYAMEIYRTTNASINSNKINAMGNYSMGTSLAHSTEVVISNNNYKLIGNSTVNINEIVEEIRPANTGIQIQQNSDNTFVVNNTVITIDVGNNQKAVCINGTKNVTVINNVLLANNLTGDDAVIFGGNSSDIIIVNNTAPIIKDNATITLIIPHSVYTGNTIMFEAIVIDSNTREKINGVVVFKLNGVTLKDENNKAIKVNVVDGVAVLTYKLIGFSAKEYKVTAVFGNDSYNRAEVNDYINVQRASIVLEQKNIQAYSGETIVLNYTIHDQNGNILYGINKVAIKINGRTIANTQVVNGILYTNISLPTGLNNGLNNLTIIIGENSRYYMTNVTSMLYIIKQNVIITIEPLIAYAGEYVTFKASIITDVTKNPITGGKYSFKINGKTIADVDKEVTHQTTVLDLKNGNAILSTYIDISANDGVYNVTVVYSGCKEANSARYTAPVLTIKT